MIKTVQSWCEKKEATRLSVSPIAPPVRVVEAMTIISKAIRMFNTSFGTDADFLSPTPSDIGPCWPFDSVPPADKLAGPNAGRIAHHGRASLLGPVVHYRVAVGFVRRRMPRRSLKTRCPGHPVPVLQKNWMLHVRIISLVFRDEPTGLGLMAR